MSVYKQFFTDLYEVSPADAAKAIAAGEKAIDRLVLKNPNMTKKTIKRGWKVYDAIVGLEDRMKEPKPKLPEGYPWGTYDYTKRDAETQPNGGSVPLQEPNDLGMISARVSDIVEGNTPTSPEKWAKAKAAARAKFKVYPSAYANLWAAKKYKSMGGGWKKGKK